ncbi:MAG: divalent-cation tolerance protein CutA [Candidatus Hadarchaeales archaeon]
MAKNVCAIVYTTCGSRREAARIAEALVSEKLVACANIFPISSIYRWKGRVEGAKEFAIILKTRRKLVQQVISRIRELHTYKIPAIVSFNIVEGSNDYLRWIIESTG